MEGALEGTRCRGRPKNSWTGHILKILDMDHVGSVRAAQQRGVWRAMAANLLRDGTPLDLIINIRFRTSALFKTTVH